MIFRVAHRFVRLEALGVVGQAGRYNDLADPQTLEVYVTPADDIKRRLQEGKARMRDHGQSNEPFKLATGVWGYDLDEAYYAQGQRYTIHWKYEMTPGNVKVDRSAFVWNPPPKYARDTANCVVWGTITDLTGTPIDDVRITVEQYRDALTMNQRVSAVDIATDLFGNWYIEVPRGAILRFVRDDLVKVVKVPTDTGATAFSKLPEWQPADASRKDKFGYPFP